MLNRVILMGRIVQDLEVRQTQGGVPVLSFTIAVDRNYARQGEERQTDFIDCVAWRQQAEFISRYFSKGRMIAIEGNLRKRTYDDKNGTKHYVTEVFVDSVSFTGEKAQQSGSNAGYGAGGYTNSGYSVENTYSAGPTYPKSQTSYSPEAPKSDIVIGELGDFEEILGDEGVPF